MQSVSPVLTAEQVELESVIALDQQEYYPVISLRVVYSDDTPATLTRFSFNEKDRKLIAEGADLLISQPHHGPLMPIGLQLAMPNSYPEE